MCFVGILTSHHSYCCNSADNLQVIAFSDEEGVRFQSTFLGSAAIAGILPPTALQISDKRLSSKHHHHISYASLFLSVYLIDGMYTVALQCKMFLEKILLRLLMKALFGSSITQNQSGVMLRYNPSNMAIPVDLDII